jgi:DNA processing protein
MTPESRTWLALALCPELTNAAALQLVSRLGSAAAITAASRQELRAAGVSETAAAFLCGRGDERLAPAIAWAETPGHHLLCPDDPLWPPLLKESGEAPLCLFVGGDPALLSLPQLAIVGSRKATPGGAETAREFAAFLAGAGLTITSGLAIGIDAEAHQGALDGGGKTIAVLGTGPDEIYPRANAGLAQRIIERGAVITEFAPGTPPRKEQFPRRNRIIAALSLGVLVVEAGIRSGSLITARLAGNYGREIFAIPGSIHSPLSKGCHQLIKQGAKLVESADDIASEIISLTGALNPPAANVAAHTNETTEINADHAELLTCMGFDPVSVDRLAERTGLTAEELSSMLLILELEGRVDSLPGGYFQLTKAWK